MGFTVKVYFHFILDGNILCCLLMDFEHTPRKVLLWTDKIMFQN